MVILLFKTDAKHTRESRELIGAFTSRILFLKACREVITSHTTIPAKPVCPEDVSLEEKIEYHIDCLFNFRHTEGLKDLELVWEEVPSDEIFKT